jgi:hypothetical protein
VTPANIGCYSVVMVALALFAAAAAMVAPVPPFIECIEAHCKTQNTACLADPDCDHVVTCLQACGSDKTCAKKCFQVPLDGTMLALVGCAEQNKCMPGGLAPPATPLVADPDCHSINDQTKCDAAGCSWCKAGAVPDSCKTKDEAKQLPPAVFACDL